MAVWSWLQLHLNTQLIVANYRSEKTFSSMEAWYITSDKGVSRWPFASESRADDILPALAVDLYTPYLFLYLTFICIPCINISNLLPLIITKSLWFCVTLYMKFHFSPQSLPVIYQSKLSPLIPLKSKIGRCLHIHEALKLAICCLGIRSGTTRKVFMMKCWENHKAYQTPWKKNECRFWYLQY